MNLLFSTSSTKPAYAINRLRFWVEALTHTLYVYLPGQLPLVLTQSGVVQVVRSHTDWTNLPLPHLLHLQEISLLRIETAYGTVVALQLKAYPQDLEIGGEWVEGRLIAVWAGLEDPAHFRPLQFQTVAGVP